MLSARSDGSWMSVTSDDDNASRRQQCRRRIATIHAFKRRRHLFIHSPVRSLCVPLKYVMMNAILLTVISASAVRNSERAHNPPPSV